MDRQQQAAIEAARRTAKKLARRDRQRSEQTVAEGVCHYSAAGAEALTLTFGWATTHRLVLQPISSDSTPVIVAFGDVADLEMAGDRAVVTEDDGHQHWLAFSGPSAFIDLQSALRAGVDVAHGRRWNGQ